MNRLIFSRLSDLIRICDLREDGYNKVYEAFSKSPFAFIFKKYANESGLFSMELERYITQYPSRQGEEYDHFVEYRWSKMIGQLTKKNMSEVIIDCVDCENKTITFYKTFLNDHLSEELRGKITKQLLEIEQSLINLKKFNSMEEIEVSGVAHS